MSSITCSHLSFSWPDDTELFSDLSFTVGAGHTGLVAPNGAGKSTLLKLVAGELKPTSGSVTVDGSLGYLPQTLPFATDLTVAEMLGVAPILAALAALAEGDASEAVFAVIGDDWDIEERSTAQLARLGLDVSLDRRLGTLSGGEVVTLGLAAQLLRRPDVLLLDEPTNNLDSVARQRLYDELDRYPGTLLLISHDRALLDRMDRIAELRDGDVQFYGGNFTAYQDAVAEAQRAAVDEMRNAESQLKLQKRQMQQARERAARRSGTAARNVKDAGLPKIVAGKLKRDAQESAARADEVHARRVDDAKARLDAAERAVRDDDVIALDLPNTEVPAGRTVLSATGLNIRRGGRTLFADNGIDLDIRGPERIALAGPNGAGKSTLLKIVNGDLQPDTGTLSRGDGRIAYLSQRLDLLDEQRSVLENLMAWAPTLSITRRRHLLAQFLFQDNRIDLPVSVLSGGERLRATLACVLYAEPAPHLLLLDEPTNNLDLVSVAQLESALNAYRGAFIVVSHDERFLDAIGIERRMTLPGCASEPS
ncbi:ABC-F family ATP-binding cassette domain-containing protein [Mycolicibacterium sp. 141076]|uniref:ribosomal protection-like ABC-F family protein n=1 Tax=Mycolicibacterium TaxID=1866885 RepID=UPI000929E5DD|nr:MULTISPECIES: ABC-F family ATP-binding cassette domain-containing protein [Mycolicibacterium]MDX1879890.1 ABC-F family ATP-binding cassette domain-containing protein [Mycolicibacterium sp. 141076]UCZ61664.1 ATP-binding cassette domain-containing protein [Mycolicibacterium phocaicum]SHU26431.1 ATPase component of ABC transporters with duplicated ATPase domain [Mycobacteroides abscessus subsp. abscessus]